MVSCSPHDDVFEEIGLHGMDDGIVSDWLVSVVGSGFVWTEGGYEIWKVAVVRSLRTPSYFPTPSGACSGSWFMIRFSHDASMRSHRARPPGVRLASFLLFFSMILRDLEIRSLQASMSQNHAINYIHKQHITQRSRTTQNSHTPSHKTIHENNHHEQRPRPILQSRQ
jgi:hypothetical protein